MYANLFLFALVILAIAIWTTDRAVLIPAVIVSGIFIGVNNTITTQAVMTVAPVERPVASAAYSFVRFIGGGLAPYAAGQLVIALNIHVPFFIASGAVLVGIIILSTAHRMLADAERVQAEQVPATGSQGATVPAGRVLPVPGHAAAAGAGTGPSSATGAAIVAAVDDTPIAGMVTEAAARLAVRDGRTVHVVHAAEDVVTGDVGLDGEDLGAAAELVRRYLDQLAAHRVASQGQLLLHATGHGAAGRMVAQYANDVGAATIVIGAPTHGGLLAAMDESSSRELLRVAHSNLLIINPAAPLPAAPARSGEATATV
jgi:MFS transporter, ACDE family, multidrug resistance protein